MVKLTPQEATLKQATRLKAALPDITRGVQRVTDSPMDKAALKVDKYLQNVTAAATSGKWQTGLRNVSLAEWKDKFIKKGVPRISAGIDAANAKVEKFYAKLFPHINAGQETMKSMPDLTLDDNINRMVAFSRHMAEFSNEK